MIETLKLFSGESTNWCLENKDLHFAYDYDLHMEHEFFVTCNDLFFWACSDMEKIESIEDLNMIQKAYDDIKDILGEDKRYSIKSSDIIDLFVCRKNGMRPQTPYFSYIDKRLHKLFLDAGEVRTEEMDVDEYLSKKEKEKQSFIDKILKLFYNNSKKQ